MNDKPIKYQTTEVERWEPEQVNEQVQLIQQVMSNNMRENEHFGQIPGCGKKKVLLKPGAEKLGLVFRLASTYEGERNPVDLGKGHREYVIKCTLTHITTGQVWGQGLGSCSTMESKYRYRNNIIDTGIAVPQEFWSKRDVNVLKTAVALTKNFSNDNLQAKKNDNGQWTIVAKSGRIENPDIADEYNTVLKMAKKRAQVDAMLTATGASDIFTQDLEEKNGHGNNNSQVENAEYEVIEEKQPPQAAHPGAYYGQPQNGNGKVNKGTLKTKVSDLLKANKIDAAKKTEYFKRIDTANNKSQLSVLLDEIDAI